MSHARIVLGVGGGIAAYKAAELLRKLTEAGPRRHRRPDRCRAAVRRRADLGGAVAPPGRRRRLDRRRTTCRTCSSAAQADLVVVAPATADLLARAAHGLADDLLTNTLLTARCPVLFAPAMHTEMWEHPATVDNVATLRRRGAIVLEPAIGRLTGADTGKGRLPEPAEIAQLAELLLHRAGRAAAATWPAGTSSISAGGTREPLDPVRFLGNASSGTAGLRARRGRRGPRRPGHAGRGQRRAARPGRRRRRPRGHRRRPARRRAQGGRGRRRRRDGRRGGRLPARRAGRPQDQEVRRRAGRRSRSTENPDVLAELVAARRPRSGARRLRRRDRRRHGDVLEHGRAKLARKGCDLLVVNAVGEGMAFGQPDNAGGDPRRRRHARSTSPLGPKARAGRGGVGRRRGRLARWLRRLRPARGPSARLATTRVPVVIDPITTSEHFVTRRLFTSESVTEGHPDKIADQISDSILDALLAQDPASRVAVETLITTGQVHVAGEVTTEAYADIPTIVRERILEIGYDSSRKGFDGASCGVSVVDRRRSRPTSRRASTPPTRRAPARASRTRSSARAPATRA